MTPTQMKVLRAALYEGDAGAAEIDSRRVRTRTIAALVADRLLYGATIEGCYEITPLGESRYEQTLAKARASLP